MRTITKKLLPSMSGSDVIASSRRRPMTKSGFLPMAVLQVLLPASLFVAVAVVGASSTAIAQQRTFKELIAGGFEIKGVLTGSYLILQKGTAAYLCGSSDAALTWTNWASKMKEVKCDPLHG